MRIGALLVATLATVAAGACSSRYFGDEGATEDGGADAGTGDVALSDATPDAASPDAAEAGPKRIFVTSTFYDGNLGGIDGGDEKCQERAAAASLGGTFLAWLGAGTTSPISRFTRSDTPYVRVDGVMVATSWSDLVDGNLLVPISVTESLDAPTANPRAWTGLAPSGVPTPETCLGWNTNAAGTAGGWVGNPLTADGGWSHDFNDQCDAFWRLYCVEQ